jgi:hypothetical protein
MLYSSSETIIGRIRERIATIREICDKLASFAGEICALARDEERKLERHLGNCRKA